MRNAERAVSRVVVVGDLAVDVVLVPSAPLVAGTDAPGRVTMRTGGSAANTARWLARLGRRAARRQLLSPPRELPLL